MVRIQGTTVITRPVEDVFDFVADERNEAKVQPAHDSGREGDALSGGQGDPIVGHIESQGRPLDMKVEVTDYARPTRLGSTTSMSTAEINGAVTFEPDPAGTRMSWSWELQHKVLVQSHGSSHRSHRQAA
jgi:carbon monoxide dehydrogenase subunit G